MRRARLGELLVQLGLLTEQQLATGLAYQSQWGGRLGEALVAMRMLGPDLLRRVLASQLQVPFVRGEQMARVPPQVVRSVPATVLKRFRVCPLRVERQGARVILYVATWQPENLPQLDELSFITRFTVRPVLALPDDIDRTLRQHGVLDSWDVAPLELPTDDGTSLEITRCVDPGPAQPVGLG
ncbi:GspE/PulE/PilB domain-containing protein [Pyxidicoccus xibeiensis]|uniref:GspE/PulE/PilB domain-containing protein n=1 Tax=Pyxidicoccus xibeiensis TaxID=2906759 RepID=UPI0020A830C2|nr:pilus assembly protein PilB [Pyxidicoccus xibeiensis]MCP3141684.1 pilus assembly protein PilB [Pyxidicoccus xibeiensis]